MANNALVRNNTISFSFLLFYRDRYLENVVYRIDLNDEEIVIPQEEFLMTVYANTSYKLYCDIVKAISTFNYYLWDYQHEKIILLFPRMKEKEKKRYKSGTIQEIFNKKKTNIYWDYEQLQGAEKRKTPEIVQRLTQMGFDIPKELSQAFTSI